MTNDKWYTGDSPFFRNRYHYATPSETRFEWWTKEQEYHARQYKQMTGIEIEFATVRFDGDLVYGSSWQTKKSHVWSTDYGLQAYLIADMKGEE